MVNSVFKDKSILFFDSGANGTHVNNEELSDSIIEINGIQSNDSVTVAGGQMIPITGNGSLLNHRTNFTPSFHTSLLSVHKTLASNDALGIFTDKDVHVIKNTESIKSLIQYILNLSKATNTMILNGKVVRGMYVIKGDSILKKNNMDLKVTDKDIDIKEYNLLPKTNFKDSTSQIKTSPKKGRFNLNSADDINNEAFHIDTSFNMALSSYNTNVPSVKISSAAELVRYFHEALNDASEECMIRIVEHNLIDNLPKVLTTKLVHKNFQSCDSCAKGNHQQVVRSKYRPSSLIRN